MSHEREDQLREDIAVLRRVAREQRADRHLSNAIECEGIIAGHERELASLAAAREHVGGE